MESTPICILVFLAREVSTLIQSAVPSLLEVIAVPSLSLMVLALVSPESLVS